MLVALLGIEPNDAGDGVDVSPHLPAWLPRVTVERLRVGTTSVHVTLERGDDEYTGVTVAHAGSD